MHPPSNPAIGTVHLAMRAALPLPLFLSQSLAKPSHDCCRISEVKPLFQRTFTASGTQLVIDNISGLIHVVGDSSGEIRLAAAGTVRGEGEEDVARALREVHLDINQTGNSVRACVNGPFRHDSKAGNSAGEQSNGRNDRHYTVRFDFELHVPSVTRVKLKTIKEGDLKVKRLSGGFDLRNINRSMELDQVSGAGDAKTVEGDVKATKATNRYMTLNGNIYSDFMIIPKSAQPRRETL
jgi:hypothetical protein